MLTLKAGSSGWTPARDAYNGLANFPVSQPGVREHFCNYCVARISTVYHADVRPSRALTRWSVLRICDLATCRPEVARPVDTSAFVGTNPTGELITSGLPARSSRLISLELALRAFISLDDKFSGVMLKGCC
jgi:hypothetical protein